MSRPRALRDGGFLRQVLAELRKVAWADRSATIHNASLVLAVVVSIVVAIAILDLAFGAISSVIG